MSFRKILGASLALVAGGVGVAQAINPASVPAANRIYFSGATATDNILENVLILQTNGVCQVGTIDIYRGVNQRVIACNAAIPGLVGQPIAFFKESLGGSGNGVNPVANATPLQFLDVDNPSFSCTGGPTSVPPTATLNGYTERTGCTPNVAQVPGAGISDVEPRLLGASQAQINNLTTQGVLGIVFAPAVSLNLYRALQQAQGLAQNDNPENIPNLTSAQVRALYTGFYADWSQFDDLQPFLPADTTVYVCRRGDTSGTQASYESYVLNQRCVDGVTGFVEATNPACEVPGCNYGPSFANDQVFAGFSSGDVRLCLDARNDQGRWAVGVLSTENTYNNTDRQFRWTRIDGAPPTLEAVANGRYSFFTENVINRRNGALNTTQTAVVNYLAANLGQPAVIAGVNAPFQANPHGDGGVIAVPNFTTINPNPSPVTQAQMRTNPVNSQVRNGNNCTPPISAGDQQSGGI
jgi:hypothetical protein